MKMAASAAFTLILPSKVTSTPQLARTVEETIDALPIWRRYTHAARIVNRDDLVESRQAIGELRAAIDEELGRMWVNLRARRDTSIVLYRFEEDAIVRRSTWFSPNERRAIRPANRRSWSGDPLGRAVAPERSVLSEETRFGPRPIGPYVDEFVWSDATVALAAVARMLGPNDVVGSCGMAVSLTPLAPVAVVAPSGKRLHDDKR